MRRTIKIMSSRGILWVDCTTHFEQLRALGPQHVTDDMWHFWVTGEVVSAQATFISNWTDYAHSAMFGKHWLQIARDHQVVRERSLMELARILQVDDSELILGMEEIISMFSGSLGGYIPYHLVEELARQRQEWIRAEGGYDPIWGVQSLR